MDLVSSYPRNLAYTLKKLENFTKQTVKVMPDRTEVNFGDVVRFKLPSSAMIDFRTIAIFADVTLPSTANTCIYHLPRNTNSLIQQLTITCNGVQICNINDYNLLYNTLYDLEGADFSQTSKRFLENPDPSVFYLSGTVAAANTPINFIPPFDKGVAENVETARPILITNLLGFISSCSTPCIDLNDTGDIYIEIRLSPTSVLWAAGTEANFISAAAAKLSNIRLTCSKINFESSEYYNLKSQKLLEDGLLVGYYDYWTARGSSVTKKSNVNMNFNINTNSLDQCIATFQKSDYQTNKNLVLKGSDAAGDDATRTFNYLLSTQQSSTTNETAAIGDMFNQSYYFMRAGCDLLTSQWSINSTNIDPYPLPPSEIWHQNLVALGNQQMDLGTSGVHAGCVSLFHFLKYYFCHILSLENLSGDGQFYRSGLSGNGSTINIGYQATFNSTNEETISPVIFCRSTKILSIQNGHIVSVY